MMWRKILSCDRSLPFLQGHHKSPGMRADTRVWTAGLALCYGQNPDPQRAPHRSHASGQFHYRGRCGSPAGCSPGVTSSLKPLGLGSLNVGLVCFYPTFVKEREISSVQTPEADELEQV
eukprot:jgi/Botrbrau1/16570/Bobra.0068s0002.1